MIWKFMKWQNEFERRERSTRLKPAWKIRLADDLNLSERTRYEITQIADIVGEWFLHIF